MNDGLRWVVTQFHLDTRFVDAMPFSYMKPLSGSGSKAMMIYFFSSRRRHTIYWRDWSSDVCSSDLVHALQIGMRIVANSDAIGDRPVEASRQQNVGAGEFVAHQMCASIRQRDFDMAQLLAEIFA